MRRQLAMSGAICVRACATVLVALALPMAAAAQVVRGTVVDRETAAPVAGVVVALVDAYGRDAARTLTSATGEYRLAANASGAYFIRTLRIGFRPAATETFALRAGDEVTRRVELASVAFLLDTVRVVTRPTCRMSADSTLSTYALWEQARTALMAAQITAQQQGMTAAVRVQARDVDRETRRVVAHQAAVQGGFANDPWHSLSPDSIRKVGYVQHGQGDDFATVYYAPSIEVLLSDGFVQDHCFRMSDASDRARIGIAFEPARTRRSQAEIRGTLWFDRATSELRNLEFGYVNLPREETSLARGDMSFVRMRDGSWAISRWLIQMPVLERIVRTTTGGRLSRSRPELMATKIREVGGELSLALRGLDTLFAGRAFTVSGVVTDSAQRPVAGAQVGMRDTELLAPTDSTGRFVLAGVYPGIYTLRVQTASLDSVGASHQSEITVDSATSMSVRVPNATQLLASFCPGLKAQGAWGVIEGKAVGRPDSIAFQYAGIIVDWVRDGRSVWRETRLDSLGRFRVCGAPIGTSIQLRTITDRGSGLPATTTIAAELRIARVSVSLDIAAGGRAVLQGVVVEDSTRRPIADAEVLLPQLGRKVYSDAKGAFRLGGLEAGIHEVLVRRIGFAPATANLSFDAARPVSREFHLARVLTLDTISVSATGTLRDFEEHRRIGLGKFLTREDLERQEGRRLSEVLSQISGVGLIRAQAGNSAWVVGGRGPTSINACATNSNRTLEGSNAPEGAGCACFVQVYLDHAPLFRGESNGMVPDINRFIVGSIEAIEFYAGPASTPAKYSTLNSNCGVIVIHTRRFDASDPLF